MIEEAKERARGERFKIAELTPGVDMEGHILCKGCQVRVFNDARYSKARGVSGLSVEGPGANFCDGFLESTDRVVDGTRRYRVKVVRLVLNGIEIKDIPKDLRIIFPEVNGPRKDGFFNIGVWRLNPERRGVMLPEEDQDAA